MDYLESEWSEKVKNGFIAELDRSLDQIKKHPKSCPESVEMKGLHRCVVTKQNSLFYRIRENEIEIITFFDNRQDPTSLKL